MLQYLVVLAQTEPLVWRRIRIPATYSFWDLHVAIQDAMGWQDYHLHEFLVIDPDSGRAMMFGIPDDDYPDERPVTADWTVYPFDYARGGPSPMRYVYDFGDDWYHAIIFEGFEEPEGEGSAPHLVGGQGACPPEDCGGPHGYAELLEALSDSEHPEHDEFMEWVGAPIDPGAFSAEDVRFDDPGERWRIAFEEDEG